MKMKLKTVAAAIALAAFAGQANAAIDPGNASLNGELFLVVWSPTLNGGTSYTRDLGISFQNFSAGAGGSANPGIAGTNAPTAGTYAFGATPTVAAGSVNASGYNLTFSADTLLAQSGLLGAADTVWMVGAVDTFGGGNNGQRTLLTAQAPFTGTTNTQSNGVPGPGNSFTSNVSLTGTHVSQANGSSVNTPGEGQAYGGYIIPNWDAAISGAVTGAINQALQFFMVTASSTSGTAAANIYAYQNASGVSTWTLDSAGQLIWQAAAEVSQVPLPAAVWLFGTGLVGLVGIARRRKSAELVAA